MTPRAQSYLSYNWHDKPLGVQIIEFYFHKIDKIGLLGSLSGY